MNRAGPTGLALGAGLANALALAWPFSGQASGPLHVLSLALLAHLFLRHPRPMQSAWLGWCFALSHGLTATWWLYISIHQHGGVIAPLAALSVLALNAALALFLALALGLAATMSSKRPSLPAQGSAFVGAVLLAELAKAQWFTGFPWGAAGYAHVDSAFAILAPWVGVYGIGAVAAGSAMALAMFWEIKTPLMRSSAWVMAGALVLALSQAWRAPDYSHAAGRVALTLLQGNVPQDQKYSAQQFSATEWYLAQLSQAGPGLTLAPETAMVLPPDLWPGHWWRAVRPTQNDRAFMSGAVWRDTANSAYSNSVLAWAGADSETFRPAVATDHRYNKHHLVPFGEFIPWGFDGFVRAMNIPMGEFERGALPQQTWLWGGLRWAPNICFEDLFGEELARNFGGEDSPNVMVNFSNLAWFGDTVAQHQHLHISRMRTLELQRPMVRTTNTGSSAVIDHRGRVIARLPHWQQAVLRAEVEGRAGAPTFYAGWVSHWGLAPLWLLGLALLASARAMAGRRQADQSSKALTRLT